MIVGNQASDHGEYTPQSLSRYLERTPVILSAAKDRWSVERDPSLRSEPALSEGMTGVLSKCLR